MSTITKKPGLIVIVIILSISVGLSLGHLLIFDTGIVFEKIEISNSDLRDLSSAVITVQVKNNEFDQVNNIQIISFLENPELYDYVEIQNDEISISYLTQKYNLSKEFSITVKPIKVPKESLEFNLILLLSVNDKELERKIIDLSI